MVMVPRGQSWWCRLLPVSGWLSAGSARCVAARLQRSRRMRGLRAQGAAEGAPRGAGGARVSGVRSAPRTPAPQCRAGARHARPAPLTRRLTAWPTRPPPPHAATLWRRYESVNASRPAANRGPLRHLGRSRSGSFLWPVIVFFDPVPPVRVGQRKSFVSIRSSAADGTRRERAPRGPLDGAAGRSCGECSPPAPRRRRLLFHAVRVHKIIIGRRRWWAGPRGAEPSLTSVEPGLAVPASPTFRHRCLRVACARHTALTRQAYTNPPPLAPTPWLLC